MQRTPRTPLGDILSIEAMERNDRGRFRWRQWRVTFASSDVADVKTPDLLSYRRFWRPVFQQTGKVHRYEPAEKPGREERGNWRSLIAALLDKAQMPAS